MNLFPDPDPIIGRITKITRKGQMTEYQASLDLDVNGGEYTVGIWVGQYLYPTPEQAAAAVVAVSEVLGVKFTLDQFLMPDSVPCQATKDTTSNPTAGPRHQESSSEYTAQQQYFPDQDNHPDA